MFKKVPTPVASAEEEDEMNTFGLSDHEIAKKLLFRMSEKDRTSLILENRRLREQITDQVDHSSTALAMAKEVEEEKKSKDQRKALRQVRDRKSSHLS